MKFELDQQTLNTIYQGLGELPLKISINAFGVLQDQQKRNIENQKPSLPTGPHPPEE